MPNLMAIHEYVDYGSAIGVLLDVVREHGEETDAEATIKRCIMALSGLPRLDPASLRAKGEWISVEERLPDLELEEILSEDMDLFPCLAAVRNERARGGRYVTKVWYNGEVFMDSDCVDVTCNVTHWMPLPELPQLRC